MKTLIAEFPNRPLPHLPPQQPQPRVQPTVYVYEKEAWQYLIVSRDIAGDAALSEDELNRLGSEGWELVGIVTLPAKVQLVFKRVKS